MEHIQVDVKTFNKLINIIINRGVISRSYNDDKEFLLFLANNGVNVLEMEISDKLLRDKDICLAVLINVNYESFYDIPEELKNDRGFIRKFVLDSQYECVDDIIDIIISYDPQLKFDKEFIKTILILNNREKHNFESYNETILNIVDQYYTMEMELTLHCVIGDLYERLLSRIGFKNIVFSFI